MRCVTAVCRQCYHLALCDDATATEMTLRPLGHKRLCVFRAFESIQQCVFASLCVFVLSNYLKD